MFFAIIHIAEKQTVGLPPTLTAEETAHKSA